MESGMIRLNKRKISLMVALFGGFCFLFVCFILFSTGVIKGVNKEIDAERDKLISVEIEKSSIEGSITDRWGMAITSAVEPGVRAEATDPECFSYLIGYNSPIYGKSGLRQKYYAELFDGGKDGEGAEIRLTIDAELQKKCYDLLAGYVGSVTVMNVRTGEILALAARADEYVGYDVNKIDIADEEGDRPFDTYNKINAFWYNRATMKQDPPGSTFKIVTSACLIENGLEDFEYYDEGYYEVSGAKIYNYGKNVYGNCDLQYALSRSVNSYFAAAGVKLGARALMDTANKYMIGIPIELDFTQLDSNIDFSGLNNSFLIASTAYGQGNLQVPPMLLCMIAQSVMNNGVMVHPYLVAKITDEGKTVYEPSFEGPLSETIGPENNAKLKALLHNNGLYYGFDEDEYGYVIAKTGTAEIENGASNHVYITLATDFGDNAYAVCIDHTNVTGATGQGLAEDAKTVLEALWNFNKLSAADNDPAGEDTEENAAGVGWW